MKQSHTFQDEFKTQKMGDTIKQKDMLWGLFSIGLRPDMFFNKNLCYMTL